MHQVNKSYSRQNANGGSFSWTSPKRPIAKTSPYECELQQPLFIIVCPLLSCWYNSIFWLNLKLEVRKLRENSRSKTVTIVNFSSSFLFQLYVHALNLSFADNNKLSILRSNDLGSRLRPPYHSGHGAFGLVTHNQSTMRFTTLPSSADTTFCHGPAEAFVTGSSASS